MAYDRNPTWRDWPDKTTPITATELENLEEGLVGAASVADTALANAADAQSTAATAAGSALAAQSSAADAASSASSSASMAAQAAALVSAPASSAIDTYVASGSSAAYRKADAGKVFNVRTYGATGNGTTDDSTAIQNAVNAWVAEMSSTLRGATLLFPPGVYASSATIVATASSSVVIIGGHIEGKGAVLKYTGASASPALTVTSYGTTKGWQRLSIHGIRLEGGGLWCRAGLNTEPIYNLNVTGIHVTKTRVPAIRLTGVFEAQVSDCFLEMDYTITPASDAESCLLIDKESGKAQPSSIDIKDTTTRGGYIGIRSPNAADVRVTGGTILAAQREGIYLSGYTRGIDGVHLENNWLSGAAGAAVRLDGAGPISNIFTVANSAALNLPYTGSSGQTEAVRCYVYGLTIAGATTAGTTSVRSITFQTDGGSPIGLRVTGGETGSTMIYSGVGTTSLSTIPSGRFTNLDLPDPDVVRIAAPNLYTITGAPSLAAVSMVPVWALDQTLAEAVAGSTRLPDSWKTYSVGVEGINLGAGAGDVTLRYITGMYSPGDDVSTGFGTSADVTTTALAQNILQEITIGSLTKTAKSDVMVRIDRRAVAADTLPNDYGIVSIVLRRTS